jgi:hypothetical protein
MRYRLRTLLIVLALGPPLLAVLWFEFIAPLAVVRSLTDTRPILKRDGYSGPGIGPAIVTPSP